MADTDPFATGLFGGSPKMAISASATSTVATTVRGNRGERAISSSGQVTKSSSARPRAMQRSRGGSLDIDKMSSKVSNVTYSEMKGRTSRLSLSDRLTPSLISAGLVKGTTPSSTRKQSGQPIQVLALSMPAGAVAEARPHAGSSSLKGCNHDLP